MTKLKELAFQFEKLEFVTWITWALKTITDENKALQLISINVIFPFDKPDDIRLAVEEEIYQQWMDLDSILIQICKSGVCHMRVEICDKIQLGRRVYKDGGATHKYMDGLLPKMMKGGLVDVVNVKNLRKPW